MVSIGWLVVVRWCVMLFYRWVFEVRLWMSTNFWLCGLVGGVFVVVVELLVYGFVYEDVLIVNGCIIGDNCWGWFALDWEVICFYDWLLLVQVGFLYLLLLVATRKL